MENIKIDKVYIIAINYNQEKKLDILKRLEMLDIPYGTPYEIKVGHNGYTDKMPEDCSAYEGWAIPESSNKWWSTPVTQGEIGCTLSHISVWEEIYNNPDIKTALILEEDFYAIKPLSELKSPSNGVKWDYAYLARYRFPDSPSKPIDDQWEIPGKSYNMHAYLLTNEGASKLLDYKLQKNIFIVDEFIMATFMQHPREDINLLYPNKNIVAISTTENLVGQSSNYETTTVSAHGMANTNIQQKMEPYFEILDVSDWDAWKAKYLNHTLAKGEYDLMINDIGNNIYEFPLFTEKFCKEAIALAEEMDNWTTDRHEFYPTNDVLLQDIKLQDIYHRVLQEVIYPLCKHIWTLDGNGWLDMFSENFMARYTTDRQSHLSLHHDFSHITMVVKLNDEFDGGGTWFPKYKILSNPERVGTATLHPGMVTHLHGARPIYSGKRYICVSFMRKQ